MFRTKALTLTAAILMGTAVGATSKSADIVETAQSAGSFGTLLAAAEAAGLVDTLKGDGPFTVFAPTDEAFAALPAGTVEDLLKPENKDKLTAILTYHVVPGKVMSGPVSVWSAAFNLTRGSPTSGRRPRDSTAIPARPRRE